MRRRRAEKREARPDPKYNSKLIGKFVNMLMERGKKSIAESIVYGALDALKEQAKDKDPIEVFNQAIENARPLLEVKSRRISSETETTKKLFPLKDFNQPHNRTIPYPHRTERANMEIANMRLGTLRLPNPGTHLYKTM